MNHGQRPRTRPLEMRDLETIETALVAAETGHLVLSTLHTLDAFETLTGSFLHFPAISRKPFAFSSRDF